MIDTIRVIKYNGNFGLFFDSSASVKVTKKILLADSLTKINLINDNIIKRFELRSNNCNMIETNFKSYVVNTDKQKELLQKKFTTSLRKKNLEIWGYRIAILSAILKFVILK